MYELKIFNDTWRGPYHGKKDCARSWKGVSKISYKSILCAIYLKQKCPFDEKVNILKTYSSVVKG